MIRGVECGVISAVRMALVISSFHLCLARRPPKFPNEGPEELVRRGRYSNLNTKDCAFCSRVPMSTGMVISESGVERRPEVSPFLGILRLRLDSEKGLSGIKAALPNTALGECRVYFV